MLEQWHHLNHAHVAKKLVKVLSILAIEDEISSENKKADRKDWKNFKWLETNDTVPQQEDLVYFEDTNECILNPREHSL